MKLRYALALLALASPAFAQSLPTPNLGTGTKINGTAIGALPLSIANGGTGVSTLTGIVKGNGTSPFSAAAAGTDYVAPGGSAGAIDVTTQAVDNNTTKAATTAFVLGQAASATPLIDGTAAAGTSTRFARADHVHPTDTTRAPTSRTITAGTGLSGGGDLTANRTLSVSLSNFSNTLAADVALNNTGTFFTGPTIAQGTTGTWFVSGHITCLDTAGPASFYVKLTDGTTIYASTVVYSPVSGTFAIAMLSAIVTSPTGNLRLEVLDAGSVNGAIRANITGLANDSQIAAFRIN